MLVLNRVPAFAYLPDCLSCHLNLPLTVDEKTALCHPTGVSAGGNGDIEQIVGGDRNCVCGITARARAVRDSTSQGAVRSANLKGHYVARSSSSGGNRALKVVGSPRDREVGLCVGFTGNQ